MSRSGAKEKEDIMAVPISKAVAAYQQTSKMDKPAGMDGNLKTIKDIPSIDEENTVTGSQFGDLVAEGLDKARAAGYNSEAVSTKAIANKAELHDLVTSVSNAELTLNTVVAIRDRMINAYQDLIKMPI